MPANKRGIRRLLGDTESLPIEAVNSEDEEEAD